MSEFSFTVLNPDNQALTPHVNEYPNLGVTWRIADDAVVTSADNITIIFDYPLREEVEFEYKNTNGFRYSDFWGAVYLGYTQIYAQEPQPKASERLENAPLINRPETEGKYGIWGHDIEDLFLDGFVEVSPNRFRLLIGS
jgi:hypothetical protein